MQGLRTGRGKIPTQLLTAQRRAPPQRAGRAATPGVQPFCASSWPPARRGPWAAPGRWPGEERALPGPARGCQGRGHTRLQHPRPPRYWLPAAPVHTHPGAGSFPPPFFPWSSAGARAPAALRVQTREAPTAAAAAGAEPSVPGSRAPLPSLARPHAAARTRGPRRRILGAPTWFLPLAALLRPRPDAQKAGGRGWAQEG